MAGEFDLSNITSKDVRVSEIVEDITRLLALGPESRARAVYYVLKNLSDLEKIHAENMRDIQASLPYVFATGMERRAAPGLCHALTLGVFRKWDASRSAKGALKDVERLLGIVEQANRRTMAHAIMRRLPLLQYLAGPQDGVRIALAMLKTFLPEEYERILQLAGERVDE